MKLVLPQRFMDIVITKPNVYGELLTLIDKFSDWFSNNKTEFFPEYTDHGIDHVQSVLNTAEDIVSDISWPHITPEDIYVLTASILLHDCAMHISKEGLWDLLENDLYNGILLGFEKEEEWSIRWNRFCNEVRRFEEYDYFNFFGEYREVELPKIGSVSLSDNQKIIIGDFVRRYHACISQVIATYGIPSKNGTVKVFSSDLNYLNQLSGLIARSHNHHLREVVDLLGDDRKREHRNTHPTFLMGVLRISDYLQLTSERTPKILFKTIAFCSPISISEWKKHLSIISTNNYHPDEELLYIEAYPEDASTLAGIKNLLMGLQNELDEYWAVTGEVYSRYKPLNQLLINYRRVKSNIDNPIKYVENNHKRYYPEVLSVRADNQKLFPLLIKPLYGDSPQIGLRELLQNAIDATNERYSQEILKSVNYESIPYDINIKIDFDNDKMSIQDNGIGMNAEIIKDYFLKIGSSYRTSEQWKNNFCKNETTNIPRTGKFGIGMLAGFLIGHEIEVHTKHTAPDAKAIKFSYKLDSKEIELNFTKKEEVGTSITIHSNTEQLNVILNNLSHIYKNNTRRYRFHDEDKSLSSWWYFLDTPKVNVDIIKDNKTNSKHSSYHIRKSHLNSEWNKIEDSDLDGYYWRHNKNYRNVYCNGIAIQKMHSPEIIINNGFSDIEINNIEVCIFDNTGKFPLNLTRDELVIDDFYEIKKLRRDISKNFKEEIDKISLKHKKLYDRILNSIEKFCDTNSLFTFIPLIFNSNKTIPFGGKEHEKSSKIILVDFIYSRQKRGIVYSKSFDEIKSKFNYSCFEHSEKKADTIEKAINFLLLKRNSTQSWRFNYPDTANTEIELTAWIYVKKYDFNKLSDDSVDFIHHRNISVVDLGEWVIISKNENSNNSPELGREILDMRDGNHFMFALYNSVSLKRTDFSDLWDNHNI